MPELRCRYQWPHGRNCGRLLGYLPGQPHLQSVGKERPAEGDALFAFLCPSCKRWNRFENRRSLREARIAEEATRARARVRQLLTVLAGRVDQIGPSTVLLSEVARLHRLTIADVGRSVLKISLACLTYPLTSTTDLAEELRRCAATLQVVLDDMDRVGSMVPPRRERPVSVTDEGTWVVYGPASGPGTPPTYFWRDDGFRLPADLTEDEMHGALSEPQLRERLERAITAAKADGTWRDAAQTFEWQAPPWLVDRVPALSSREYVAPTDGLQRDMEWLREMAEEDMPAVERAEMERILDLLDRPVRGPER